MRIATTLTIVAVTSSLVALTVYGVWTISLRRAQLRRELSYEEANLAVTLKSALEMALEHRHIAEAEDVVEKLSAADRIYGIAVHSASGQEVAASRVLSELFPKVPTGIIDPHLQAREERQFEIEVADHKFLVHILPLEQANGTHLGTAELWRDLGYIDEYQRGTTLRLIGLAVLIGVVLTGAIIYFTRRSVTRPAAALIEAMEQVSAGNLDIRLSGSGKALPGELGDIAQAFDRLTSGLQEAQLALASSQHDRESLASRLRQSERLSMLGQVIAEVAHELGTPLNVITGRAEILSQELKDDAASLQTVEQITAQARRIARIIDRLLTVSRERMPALSAVPLLKVARSTSLFLAPELERAGVTMSLEGDESISALADEDLMQQVLINLVGNAIHASPRQSLIRVSVSAEGDQVSLDVIDQGTGVSPDILPRLFEPFATTKPAGKGTGLGLPISRSILRQMGGSLRYIEGVERGAHFRATLPSAGAQPVGEAATHSFKVSA
jgi:signal transduction histidine kinase